MRIYAILFLVFILPATLLAEDSAEPKQLLASRGKQVKEESFKTQTSVEKGNPGNWYIYKGKFEVIDGQLKVSEQKEDAHHPAMSSKLPSKNLVMQCRFKVGDSKWMGLSLDNGKAKEHVFRAIVSKTGLQVKRMSGMGPTTKGENITKKDFKFETDKWYTLYVEIVDKEVCVQIPEAQITVFGENEGIAQEKDRVEIICGGENAWFDEVKIWEAERNPKWAEVKNSLPPPPPAATKK